MSGNSAELKILLKEIRDNDYRICEVQDYFSLAQAMVAHLGSPDPVLRDDLIYDILANWITTDRLSAGQLKQLLDVCLDSSHLFYSIGEYETDSVFARSFSALAIALIIDAHRRHGFLSGSERHQGKDRPEAPCKGAFLSLVILTDAKQNKVEIKGVQIISDFNDAQAQAHPKFEQPELDSS
jgi:hypothetical protein